MTVGADLAEEPVCLIQLAKSCLLLAAGGELGTDLVDLRLVGPRAGPMDDLKNPTELVLYWSRTRAGGSSTIFRSRPFFGLPIEPSVFRDRRTQRWSSSTSS